MKKIGRPEGGPTAERELTEKEMTVRTGHDRTFFKKARKNGLKHLKYGRQLRYLWSWWLEFREQHKQAG